MLSRRERRNATRFQASSFAEMPKGRFMRQLLMLAQITKSLTYRQLGAKGAPARPAPLLRIDLPGIETNHLL